MLTVWWKVEEVSVTNEETKCEIDKILVAGGMRQALLDWRNRLGSNDGEIKREIDKVLIARGMTQGLLSWRDSLTSSSSPPALKPQLFPMPINNRNTQDYKYHGHTVVMLEKDDGQYAFKLDGCWSSSNYPSEAAAWAEVDRRLGVTHDGGNRGAA
jgi:hypothetical protein